MATTYMINKKKLTHEEHQKIAKDLGGDLVCISSENEQKMVETLMENSKISNAWIGAERILDGAQGDAAHWKWDDGSKWEYTKWAEGEPNLEEIYVKLQIPEGWQDHKDHYASAIYKIPKTQYIANPKIMTFSEHQKFAESVGLSLVSIHTAEQNEVVRKLAHLQKLGDAFWIGGIKRGSNFVWVDDSSWEYDNWDEGQPNKGNENVAKMHADGTWHDYSDNNPSGAVYMITSLFKKQFEAATAELQETNKKIKDYNYELYEKPVQRPPVDAELIQPFGLMKEGFIEGNDAAAGETSLEDYLDENIEYINNIINENEKITGDEKEQLLKYQTFSNNFKANQAAIEDDTEAEKDKFNKSMKEKIIYMDYEDGLFDEINASLDGSTARDNNRLTFYQGQQMDTLKFINQKILFWIYVVLLAIYGYALQYTDIKPHIKMIYIGLFVLFPFIAYYIEYYLFRLIHYIYKSFNRNAYSKDNF